jgi:tetratricopeptide (TPR) repeat protein
MSRVYSGAKARRESKMEVYSVILRLLFLVLPLLLTAGCVAMESDAERDTRAYFDRGEVYSAKGQYDQAIAEYTKAAELSPRRPEIYNNRGLAYTDKGEYDQAIADYNKALEINPNFAMSYYSR